MQAEKEQLRKLLEKYLRGNATPDEVHHIHQWITHLNLSEQELFRNAAEEEEARLKMRADIRARIKPEVPVKKLNPFPLWLRAMAASVLLLAGLFLVFNQLPEKGDKMLSFSTGGSGIKKVNLPDGTEVTLNLYSKLEIKEGFNRQERRVKITGEAFFDVKKDSLKPFIVESGSLQTHVLGTAFNVEYYEGEQQTRVSLLRGKVRVQKTKGEARNSDLLPGQMLVYDRQNNQARTEAIAVRDVAGWMESRIIFNDVPLADAISRLKQRYNLHIQLEEGVTLDRKFVTGEYSQGAVEEVLQAILLVHDMQAEKKGGVFYVTQ